MEEYFTASTTRGSHSSKYSSSRRSAAIERQTYRPFKATTLGRHHCGAAGKVVDAFRPWIHLIESVNLAPQGSAFQNPQLLEFSSQKQKAYDSVADLVASCQAVTAPLADEWAESRGQSLEDRLNTVRGVSRVFDSTVSQIGYLLQLLSDTTSMGGSSQPTKDHRMTDGEVYEKAHLRVDAPYDASRRPQLGDIGQSHSYTIGTGPPQDKYRRPINTDKATQFFGQCSGRCFTRLGCSRRSTGRNAMVPST